MLTGFSYYIAAIGALSSCQRLPEKESRVTPNGPSASGIPEKDIRRRFERSMSNFFEIYMKLADVWEVYDNSGDATALIASGRSAGEIEIVSPDTWQKFRQARR